MNKHEKLRQKTRKRISPRLNDDPWLDRAEVVSRMKSAGLSVRFIAAHLGISRDEVVATLNGNGFIGFSGNLPNLPRREAAENMYLDGFSIRQIAKQLGVSFQAVHDLLRRSGVQLRNRGGKHAGNNPGSRALAAEGVGIFKKSEDASSSRSEAEVPVRIKLRADWRRNN